MIAWTRWTRALALAPLLAAVSVLAACDDSPTDEDHDHAEEVASIRIAIGASVVVMNTSGTVTSGPNPVIIGTGTHTVGVSFLDDAGATINSELEGEFEARLTPANTALVTFARTGAFAGTLTRVAPGSTTLSVVLFHTAENHEELGPFPLGLTVQ
jgi:hypothetical protein